MSKRPKRRIKPWPKRLEALSTMVIEPEEIFYLVKEMSRHHEEGREADWEVSVLILISRYPKDPDRALCIAERMRCLREIMKDDRMGGWSLKTNDPECSMTNEAVFRSVAKCPLRTDADHIWFDPDEFFDLTLREVESEGNA